MHVSWRTLTVINSSSVKRRLMATFSRNDILRSTSAMEVERTPSRSEPSTSLADELSSAAEEGEEVPEQPERVRRLESDISALKDQNKALTLYVNKIIERILQHQGGYENILSNHDEDDAPAAPGATATGTARALPPVPNKDKGPATAAPIKGTMWRQSKKDKRFCKEQKSVAYGTTTKPRPRPATAYIAGRTVQRTVGHRGPCDRSPPYPLAAVNHTV